jgi:hypothetical protein
VVNEEVPFTVKVFADFFDRDRICQMLANLLNKVPKETMRIGAYVAVAGFAGAQIFPVLRDWEVFSMFPSKHFIEREVCIE